MEIICFLWRENIAHFNLMRYVIAVCVQHLSQFYGC